MTERKRNLLAQIIYNSGLTKSQIAKALGIAESTLYNKLRGLPYGEFTVSEAVALGKILHLTKDEVFEIFFADIVTQN